jgi:hypothetical protein
MCVTNRSFKTFILFLFVSTISSAQFFDSFDKEKIEGWFSLRAMERQQWISFNGTAMRQFFVDATKDKYNVYWALIKRDVTPYLDLSKLKDTDYQLRVEAKVSSP